MTVREVGLFLYALPFRHPWPSADGPRDCREGAILLLTEEEGAVGLGDAAPWPGFGTETLASSRAALALASKLLVGLPADSYLEAVADLPRLAPVAASPAARCAIDLALHDLAARHAGVPIARLLGGERTLTHVFVNATIPRLGEKETVEAATSAVERGAKTIKVKVGGAPLAEDTPRIASLRRAVGPEIAIRLDANQAWSEEEAIVALGTLAAFDLEYVEQPVAADNIEGLARVRAKTGVPIAADEAVRDADTARRILSLGAADVIILKPMVLGGLHASLRVAALAREWGKEVVVTSLLESPIGRAGALHLAAALGPARHAHGVSTRLRFAAEEGGEDFDAVGAVRLPSTPGLGVEFTANMRAAAVRLAPAEREAP